MGDAGDDKVLSEGESVISDRGFEADHSVTSGNLGSGRPSCATRDGETR